MLKGQTKIEEVLIPCDHLTLHGLLHMPIGTKSIVLFVHGSGSSRLSKRNQFVANVLTNAKIGILLFDLLTQEEEAIDAYTREWRFNIELLAARLSRVTEWITNETSHPAVGYFGASTGAAAALIAAADNPAIKAVVSRGGRPDLAGYHLENVKAPTLFIVGSLDDEVIELNKHAMKQMQAINELIIVPGATHLFEEPGTLEEVSRFAKDWFVKYLT